MENLSRVGRMVGMVVVIVFIALLMHMIELMLISYMNEKTDEILHI